METLIGEVPDEWGVTRLAEIGQLHSGVTLPSEERAAHGVRLLLPRGVNRRRRIEDADPAWVSRETARRHASYTLAAGDIICTRSGDPGRFALVGAEQGGWLLSSSLLRIRLRPEAPVDPGFLLHYLSLPAVKEWVDQHSKGVTSIRSVSLNILGTLPVVLPPRDTQQSITAALDLLDEKAALHEEISRTTARLRDTLAPVFLTGASLRSG